MNIKILDSWLREYVKTKATPQKISELLSLSSVSVERLESFGDNDFTLDIEVTTNRPDLMSVIGIARETAVILNQSEISAEFIEPQNTLSSQNAKQAKRDSQMAQGTSHTVRNNKGEVLLEIRNNPDLVNRICAVVIEVSLKDSPQYVKDRLESSDIRSINNVIDITNYIMREMGHPTHAFDYDRLVTKRLEIREARRGEKVVTLDNKTHTLSGGDIVADDGLGHIVDLLGVMGTQNSVITGDTKKILFFVDNAEEHHIRKTSMTTGIRTEAAILNEKGIDPKLAKTALLRGIELFKKLAGGKLISEILDIYPNPVKIPPITINENKIQQVIGIPIPMKTSELILLNLGFHVIVHRNELHVTPPSWRAQDVQIEEDIIEEIARVYGYHKIPNQLPPLNTLNEIESQEKNEYYWEKRVKNALKYWGFTESYTYSLVSGDLYEGPLANAITLKNPLSQDMTYMRNSLVPSILQVLKENSVRKEIKIFELSNVYFKNNNLLPSETRMLAGAIKKEALSFYDGKGIVEELFQDLGIKSFSFKPISTGGLGADVYIDKKMIGNIEMLEDNILDFELNFEKMLKHVSLKKNYVVISKYPPIIEDITIDINPITSYEKIVSTIKKVSSLIADISLIDTYKDRKTFRITYQNQEKNLTNEEVKPIRERIHTVLKEELKATIA